MGSTAMPYATETDFCKALTAEMDRLYLLAYLLTANHVMAEQCFTQVVERSFPPKPVFREWVASWIRREIAKSALELVAKEGDHHASEPWFETDEEGAAAIRTLLQLSPFLRFVYVLTVLEGYSPKECALLLDASTAAVVDAKKHALEKVHAVDSTPRPAWLQASA